MSLVEHDDVLKALAFDGAYYSFGIWILPWRSWRANNFFDAHIRDSLLKEVAVDSVAITNQKPRCFLVRKGLDDLLCGPFRRWVRRHIEVHDMSSIVAQYDKREQYAKCRCRHREEVDAHCIRHVILQKSAPCLRRWLSMPNHVLVNGRLGYVVAEQF